MHKHPKKDRDLRYFFGLFVFSLLFLVIISFSSCLKEETFEPFTESLSFSLDTLRFDTVFTSVGSATREIRIRNTSNENIFIESIKFENNSFSKFRMNVDGVSGQSFDNVEIRANDSIYVFAEVTIDPDEPLTTSPFIISDAIVFEGSNSQKVILEAWGQNANYLPSKSNAGKSVGLRCSGGTVVFDDPKPYVIYGRLLIDSCTIDLPPGTQIYVHGGIANFDGTIASDGALFFGANGTLLSNGTLDNPVIIQGDRLETVFDDVEGQWTGIGFVNGSSGNQLTNTVIKNSIIGVLADSATSVHIDKCQIYNTSSSGVIGRHAEVTISNSLLYQNGRNSVSFTYGGDYSVKYSTLANFENQEPAIFLNNYQCQDADCNSIAINPLKAEFVNTIVSGSNGDELFFDGVEDPDSELFEMSFTNCVIATDEVSSDEDFISACTDCLPYLLQDSFFIDLNNYDYMLHSMSSAIGEALVLPDVVDDITGVIRDPNSPDIGCYEFSE